MTHNMTSPADTTVRENPLTRTLRNATDIRKNEPDMPERFARALRICLLLKAMEPGFRLSRPCACPSISSNSRLHTIKPRSFVSDVFR